jgi:PBP1b-binding outer membrane lipoprotein LpoB
MKMGIVTNIVSAFATAVLLTSCSNPEGDLKKAEEADTEQAYQEFIQKHTGVIGHSKTSQSGSNQNQPL